MHLTTDYPAIYRKIDFFIEALEREGFNRAEVQTAVTLLYGNDNGPIDIYIYTQLY